MAKRVAGVTEKLMEAAKQEFLKNGYERASLQTIAEKEQFTFATRTKRACIVPLYSPPWMIFVV